MITLGAAADQLAGTIPFDYERRLAGELADPGDATPADAALRRLTSELAAVMDLPEGMTVHVTVVDEDIVNAGASLGGELIVYRGLLEKMPSENALALVLAHEIAHVKHRHPIRALGRGMVVALAGAVLLGVDADGAASSLLQGAGTLTLLGFSRAQEREADADAIAAVNAHYGHVGGALEAYEVLLAEAGGREPPQMLSTHPHTGERIERLRRIADEAGYVERPPRALPADDAE